MTRLGVAWRLLALTAAFGLAAPPQWLALKLSARRIAGWPPVLFHRAFLALFGVRVSVRGTRPNGLPTLVLANHVSWLDIAVLGSLQPLSFVAKSEVARWPVFGTFARLQRTIFIDRALRRQTADVSAAIAERLAAGEIILVFPEGTTGDGNRLLPFRSSLVGAARAALAQGAPDIALQPLAIRYARRNGIPVTRRERPAIAWYGDMELLPHLAAFLREGPLDAEVIWGPPIRFDEIGDRKAATAAAERAVRHAVRSGEPAPPFSVAPVPVPSAPRGKNPMLGAAQPLNGGARAPHPEASPVA